MYLLKFLCVADILLSLTKVAFIRNIAEASPFGTFQLNVNPVHTKVSQTRHPRRCFLWKVSDNKKTGFLYIPFTCDNETLFCNPSPLLSDHCWSNNFQNQRYLVKYLCVADIFLSLATVAFMRNIAAASRVGTFQLNVNRVHAKVSQTRHPRRCFLWKLSDNVNLFCTM